MAYKLLQAAVCSTLLITEVLGAPFLVEDPANQFLHLKRQVVHLQDLWNTDYNPDGRGIALADEVREVWTVLKASVHRYFDRNNLAFDISAA
ncbi:uncharacterized protein C3orf85 homolog [Mesocricetus auratus]|uniref:Uncharacterized protein C3orf85 homolog n=1 Tax=Mesocricetus auratus TaxID=10036 RepID=A0ABM2XVT8_MESAU|nr:uncharacterized protein C3orf85 homolog [Mesocricetus auratus]